MKDGSPCLGAAVVADEHRPPRHLADLGVLHVGRDHELAFGELVDRPEHDVLLVLVRERRQHREAEHRHRDQAADDGAEAERRDGEEGAARIRLRLARPGRLDRLVRLALLGLDGRRRGADGLRDVAEPEEAEGERDHGADDGDDRADDDPGQDARDTDGEPDRPEARRRQVRLVVLAQVSGFNPCVWRAVNDVSAAATRGESHSVPKPRRRASVSRTRPSGGRRAP